MALCREIVSGALRKIGKLGAGREPRPADQTDTLAALQGLYRQWINQGAFGRLSDVIPTGVAYTARENERVFRQQSQTLQITLPEVVDAYTWPRSYPDERTQYDAANGYDANKRSPRDCAVVVIADAFTGVTVEFIYDAQAKVWQPIDGLTLDTHAPLSNRDPEGLKSYLAAQIVDEFGGTMGAPTMTMARNFMSALTHRYSTPGTSVQGVYC